MIDLDRKIAVCDSCLSHSCIAGKFYCENAKEAGSREFTIAELFADIIEHPCWYLTPVELELLPNYFDRFPSLKEFMESL